MINCRFFIPTWKKIKQKSMLQIIIRLAVTDNAKNCLTFIGFP